MTARGQRKCQFCGEQFDDDLLTCTYCGKYNGVSPREARETGCANLAARLTVAVVLLFSLASCVAFCSSGGGGGRDQDLRNGTDKMINGEPMTDDEADAVGDFLRWQKQQNDK